MHFIGITSRDVPGVYRFLDGRAATEAQLPYFLYICLLICVLVFLSNVMFCFYRWENEQPSGGPRECLVITLVDLLVQDFQCSNVQNSICQTLNGGLVSHVQTPVVRFARWCRKQQELQPAAARSASFVIKIVSGRPIGTEIQDSKFASHV